MAPGECAVKESGSECIVTGRQVSIVPPDARESELYVEKEGEPPGPAQAAFKGLVPGRAYNISVQTVSEPEISAPTTAQYRTVPLRPRDVAVPPADRTATAFRVTWQQPKEERCGPLFSHIFLSHICKVCHNNNY